MANRLTNFVAAMRDAVKSRRLGRKRGEPHRDSVDYPLLMGSGAQNITRKQIKPSTFNLRYFSRTPYVRAAIDSIKNPITENGWEIVPIDKKNKNSEIKRQMEVATYCFNHPNHDDSFETLLGLIIEDWCVFGAGCIEHQASGDMARPVWMWPVDAQSIYVLPGWSGARNEARYMQAMGYNTLGMGLDDGILLRNDELTYIRANAANDTPYGFGPVQVAFNSISRILGAGAYAGNKASNASPENLIWIGKADPTRLAKFRNWWTTYVEGQGQIPITGSDDEPKAIKLHGGDDKSLYLEWQEFIIREIATAFSLTPMNLGIERDVNRATAEVLEEKDYARAIRPLANMLAMHLTREVLHAKLGWYGIQFRFSGLDREDQLLTSEIYEKRYKNNMVTPNEERDRIGLEPLDNYFGDKLCAEVEIEVAAARGAAQVDDPDVDAKPTASKPKAKKTVDK